MRSMRRTRLACLLAGLVAIAGPAPAADDFLLIDAGGRTVGSVMNVTMARLALGELGLIVRVVSATGYVFDVDLNSGDPRAVVALGGSVVGTIFPNSDCTGLAIGPLRPGITVDLGGALLFVDRDAQATTRSYRSVVRFSGFGDDCVNEEGTIQGHSLALNDESVTGIDSGGYAVPLRLVTTGAGPDRIFGSGFESGEGVTP